MPKKHSSPSLWQETKYAVVPVTISFSLIFLRTLYVASQHLSAAPASSLFFNFTQNSFRGVYALGGLFLGDLLANALLLLIGLPLITGLWLLQTAHLEKHSFHSLVKKAALNIVVVIPLLSAIMGMSLYLLANVLGRVIYFMGTGL